MSQKGEDLTAFHAGNSLDLPEPLLVPDSELFLDVIGRIDGVVIEEQLQQLSAIGSDGRLKLKPFREPERYPTNRLALSVADERARAEFLRPLMEEAGLEVEVHPFADIGILPGEDRKLAPLVLASHIDTVPDGDMYDGVYGVVSAIAVGKAMNEAGFKPARDIIVLSYTGEESSRFGFPCFGSRAIFHGLTDQELSSRESSSQGGKSIREIIGEEDAKIVKEPIFGEGKRFKQPYGVFELHVEQDSRLWDSRIDVGLVENIAAPIRHMVRIGEDRPLEPEPSVYPVSQFFEISANGIAAHSGATPMGEEFRSDGLFWTSTLLSRLYTSHDYYDQLSVGQVTIEGSAINKIPGRTTTQLRISGESQEEIDEIVGSLKEEIGQRNTEISISKPTELSTSIQLRELAEDETDNFFDSQAMFRRQSTALTLIKAVEQECSAYPEVVGTIGTFETDQNGVITLGMDVRGVEKDSRDAALKNITKILDYYRIYASIDFGEPLAGSGDPIPLSQRPIDIIEREAYSYEIATTARMNSKALHDVANAALTGVGCGLIFVPSKQGVAHNPNAYTPKENLEAGARVLTLAALIFSRQIQFIDSISGSL